MREHADFEWDNERSVPTASPETWEAYLKVRSFYFEVVYIDLEVLIFLCFVICL